LVTGLIECISCSCLNSWYAHGQRRAGNEIAKIRFYVVEINRFWTGNPTANVHVHVMTDEHLVINFYLITH